MRSKISLVKSRNSYQGVSNALKLLEKQIKALIKKAKRPVIKVNFVSAHHQLSATPVEAVKAVIDFFRRSSNVKILVAEATTLGTTGEAWENYDYYQLEKMQGVELYDLGKDRTLPLQILDRDGQSLTVPFSTCMRDSDFLISLTRPKTHDAVVLTLTGKNIAVGGIVGERGRVHQGRITHQNLVKILEEVFPHLAVLDGTVGMEGEGPVFGEAIKSCWAAASLDWLAIDTLAVYLMGYELENIGYLYLAREKKIGNVFPDGVEIIGENPELLRKHFKPHPTYSSQIKWREPNSRVEEFKNRLIARIKRILN